MDKASKIQIIDKIVIVLLPIIAGLIGIKCTPINQMSANNGIENCKMMLDIWGVMLGFVITALSILLTVHENRYIEMLISTGHFKTVLFSYVSCCIYLFIAVIISIIIIFSNEWNNCIYNVFKGLIIITIVSLGICLFFMTRIIFKHD